MDESCCGSLTSQGLRDAFKIMESQQPEPIFITELELKQLHEALQKEKTMIKAPSDIPAIRVMMMPRDCNPSGTIFGGIILSLIDQAGVIEAMRQAPQTYVTVKMNEVVFKKSVRVEKLFTKIYHYLIVSTENLALLALRNHPNAV